MWIGAGQDEDGGLRGAMCADGEDLLDVRGPAGSAYPRDVAASLSLTTSHDVRGIRDAGHDTSGGEQYDVAAGQHEE